MITSVTSCDACGREMVVPHAREEGAHRCETCHLRGIVEPAIGPKHDGVGVGLVVEALAAALDAREHETGLHSQRVACHTMVLARLFTDDPARLQQIYWGALLHDIGKIAIPDSILLKQGPLTETEWDVMRSHPERGRAILESVPFMATAVEIVLAHEERFDGTGYPQGLRGDEIPWGARLFAVIDTLDAITSDRPYREGLTFDVARAEIERMSGTQFDPLAVEAFTTEETMLRQMVEMKCSASEHLDAPGAGAER